MNRVVAISREFGSGGRTIGKKVAGKYDIPCYDYEIITEIAKNSGLAEEYIRERGEYTASSGFGSPLSFKMTCKMFNPERNHPMIFETVIISCTVLIMCPAMSLIAAFLYYPYYNGFNVFTLFANWIKLICYNFPFAFFSQVFFIQPFVRFLFGKLFAKDIAARNT